MFPPELVALLEKLLESCKARGEKIAVAESCTGGLLAAAITAIPGSSEVFDRGFVTYSNEAKTQMLGVPEELIAAHGAVSAEVAIAMAEGALANSSASISAAITGIAGPGGGSPAKPVGTVFIAVARREGPTLSFPCLFSGTREEIRLQAVGFAAGEMKHR